MKRSRLTVPLFSPVLVIFAIGLCFTSQCVAAGQPDALSAGFSMVFDPQSHRYYCSGTLKLARRTADQIEVSLDGGSFQSATDTIQIKDEGKHHLSFRSKHNVTAWSPVQQLEVFVDRTPPTSQVSMTVGRVTKRNGNLFIAGDAKVTFVVEDAMSGVSGVEVAKDGQNFVAYTGPIPIEGDGKQSWLYRAKDRVGNVEEVKRLEFIVDNSPPLSEIHPRGVIKPALLKNKFYLVAREAVQFEISAQDTQSEVKQIWYSVDGGEYLRYGEPISFLNDGPKRLTYYAEDNVGNKEKPSNVDLYTVTTPPVSTAIPEGKFIKEPTGYLATSDFELRFEAKDSVAGLDRIEVQIDDAKEFKPYFQPIRFLTLGAHRVNYRAVDHLGSMEPLRTFNVTQIETAPETLLETKFPLASQEGILYSTGPNIVSFKVKDKGVTVVRTLVSVNGEPFAPYPGPISISTDQRINRISYKSIDKLGNEEIAKTTVIYMVSSGKEATEMAAQAATPQPQRPAAAPPEFIRPIPKKVSKKKEEKSRVPASKKKKKGR